MEVRVLTGAALDAALAAVATTLKAALLRTPHQC